MRSAVFYRQNAVRAQCGISLIRRVRNPSGICMVCCQCDMGHHHLHVSGHDPDMLAARSPATTESQKCSPLRCFHRLRYPGQERHHCVLSFYDDMAVPEKSLCLEKENRLYLHRMHSVLCDTGSMVFEKLCDIRKILASIQFRA